MNYLGHGYRFVNRPWFLAGTAAPDWLSVVNRKLRIREAEVNAFAPASPADVELAAGIRRHLDDDRWFHRNPVFVETSREVTALLRAVVGRDGRHRLSFFGHVAVEVLLDSALARREPGLVDDYYAGLATLDVEAVEGALDRVAGASTRLAPFLSRLRSSEFLRDYADDERLLFRLNQVMRRVGVPELPDRTLRALAEARAMIRARADALLPPPVAAPGT